MTDVTVGIDIGTTSVKAVAADGDGEVLARARVPHRLNFPAADRMEHDPNRAWRRGVREALRQVADAGDVKAANVAAMVPSLCAVNARGGALTPGLLYGDARGGAVSANPAESGELVGFLRWCAGDASDAEAFWPAQAMANHALGGEGVIDTVTAMTAVPLFDYTAWDEAVAAGAGAATSQLPRIVPGDQPAGRLTEIDGALLGGGSVDAFAEQTVAGADREGDVFVILGATLICWAVIPEWVERDGLWTIPHTTPGLCLIGGPSNAGGLFQDWARRAVGDGPERPDDPGRVPVWLPYVRGERVPLHDPDRRAELIGLEVVHDGSSLRRAAHEASGYVIRHVVDLAGLSPKRIVASGGGTRAHGWVQAIADATGLPVHCTGVPEGGALGTAYLARVVAGLEDSADSAGRWASAGRVVDPDSAWVKACTDRYATFKANSTLT